MGSGDGVNRVAIVTGAARGIGAATVAALADAGWSVLAVDAACDDPALPYSLGSKPDLAELASGQVQPHVADVRDGEAMAEAVAVAEDRWGGVDAAIAVAGVIAGGVPFWEMPVERERAVLAVDLDGVLNLARAAIPALLRRPMPREGRFLAVASAAASRGLPMLAAYCAAKAGVVGFVRALAVELGGTGITANVVNPGSTDTAILAESARLYGLADPAMFARQQPIGRLLAASEIAAVLAFLAGPAGAALTGAAIPVDGGLAL
ncbi:MAG TPA: mycofactocin-coupled SDR family oxidoreductase [Pseudonocardiaceae bacterium]